jgi:hypothetical protein
MNNEIEKECPWLEKIMTDENFECPECGNECCDYWIPPMYEDEG